MGLVAVAMRERLLHLTVLATRHLQAQVRVITAVRVHTQEQTTVTLVAVALRLLVRMVQLASVVMVVRVLHLAYQDRP